MSTKLFGSENSWFVGLVLSHIMFTTIGLSNTSKLLNIIFLQSVVRQVIGPDITITWAPTRELSLSCSRGVAKHALCFFLPTAPANAQIVHSGAACNVNDDNISERIYTIKEGDTLVLQCIVKGHPRPQVSSQSDPFPILVLNPLSLIQQVG